MKRNTQSKRNSKAGVWQVTKYICLSMILIFGLTSTIVARDGGRSSKKKKWTLMLYLDGEDILMESDYIAAFDKIVEEQIGSTDEVNVVVQFDRLPGGGGSDKYGDWTICHRFYVTPGMEPTEENAISDWKDGKGGGREVDTCYPDTLSDFVNWAIKQYRADKYCLIVGDHGFSWKGLLIDATTTSENMSIKQLRQALDNVKTEIDVFAMDACLMQNLEVAYEIKDCGFDIMVGSENSGTKWPLWDIIKYLTDDPTISGVELAEYMIDAYHDLHDDDSSITLSALDVSKINSLANAVGELAYESIYGSDDSVIDQKAHEIMSIIEEAVIYMKNGTDWKDKAHGISIYFPDGYYPAIPELFRYYYVSQILSFPMDQNWRDLLFHFLDPMGYPDYLNSKIFHARPEMETFDASDNIDLYDFCSRIISE